MELRCIHHGVVDSTSERAFAALAAGTARHGDVHIAVGQTAGRGRLGRTWHSAPGEGLYASLVLLPPPPALNPPALTIAAGLAVHDAARGLGCARACLEWPNDLTVEHAKLAGVLVETRGLDPARPHYVIGVGLNVRQTRYPAVLTSERAAVSLVQLGVDVSIDDAALQVADALARRFECLTVARAELARDYLAATQLCGRRVVVRTANEEQRGRLEALDLDEGELVLRAGERCVRVALSFVREVATLADGE